MNTMNLVFGMKINRLTAIRECGRNKHGHSLWLFRCDCGKEKVIEKFSVTRGTTKSCGCLNNEVRKSGANRRTHGMCHKRLHRIWQAMKSRCKAPEGSENYEWYVRRGIKVCDEWQQFAPFMEWALENGYRDDLTIDRIDYNGNYAPDNCRWATWEEQANNKRGVNKISYNGQTHTITEWSRITGLPRSTINARFYRGERGSQLFRPIAKRYQK